MTSTMTTILGIAGSLRAKSYNAMLLRAAVELERYLAGFAAFVARHGAHG